jgi:hypothetical protein
MRTRRSAEAWNTLFERLAKLKAGWPSRGWSWDNKLECVTSSFSTQFEADARAASAMALPQQWTPSALAHAPARLRDLAERAGGIRSSQMILTDDAAGDYLAFGLWWPWGNAMTISLRIGLSEGDASQSQQQKLRDVFGVEL